jgi:predicted ester cyclase
VTLIVKEDRMSEENKRLIRGLEEAWASNDMAQIDRFFAPEFDNSATAMPGLPPGVEGAKMAHQGAMQSFPDRTTVIEDVLAEDDEVMVRGRYRGTNQGGVPFMDVPANGNPIDVAFVSVYRIEDGKIVEHWGLNDAAALMQQLGATPQPTG